MKQITVRNDVGTPFTAVLEPNEDPTKDIVKFYDARYDHTEFGQPMGASYYKETLLGVGNYSEDIPGQGLTLHGGVADWYLDGNAFDTIKAWLREDAERVMELML